ncbi:hypothetical protein T10_10155 [Trichinella papuae]|uniref:Uncharacterized protein n=1 Tax=Trichinella papuae TaxID=268474 RepID=A0A0V1LVK7_9BILA|nr:hypothetical protein T10_10155 [Trichinella papuae]
MTILSSCQHWDAEKVRPAYIGERVVTPRTPVGPSLT